MNTRRDFFRQLAIGSAGLFLPKLIKPMWKAPKQKWYEAQFDAVRDPETGLLMCITVFKEEVKDGAQIRWIKETHYRELFCGGTVRHESLGSLHLNKIIG